MVGAAARAQSAPPVDSTVNLDLGAGISGRQNNGGRAVVVRKVLRAVAVGQLVGPPTVAPVLYQCRPPLPGLFAPTVTSQLHCLQV